MRINQNTVITPLPTDELIEKKEQNWRVQLPEDYKDFIKKYNGGVPVENSFILEEHSYAIDRFLGILNVTGNDDLEWYDIGVTITQIGERLTDNEDLIGVDMLPIAVLFAGDFICLDFRNPSQVPGVYLWSHEESEEFEPVLYCVANSFDEFLEILTEG